MLFNGQTVPEGYTKNKTSGGNEKENKKRVSITLGRINVAHLACMVDNRPCHSLHDRHPKQGKRVHEAGHEAHPTEGAKPKTTQPRAAISDHKTTTRRGLKRSER